MPAARRNLPLKIHELRPLLSGSFGVSVRSFPPIYPFNRIIQSNITRLLPPSFNNVGHARRRPVLQVSSRSRRSKGQRPSFPSNLLTPSLQKGEPSHSLLFDLFVPFFFFVRSSLSLKFERSITPSALVSFGELKLWHFRNRTALPDQGVSLLCSSQVSICIMRIFSRLLGLIACYALFDSILADSIVTQSNGLVLLYSTSGTTVQTFVLHTTVVTSCAPCTATAAVIPAPSTQVQTTSAGFRLNPRIYVVAGMVAPLGAFLFIFA